MKTLTPEQLEELKLFDTPTVSNAIESFKVRPKTEGFTNHKIKCIIPSERPMVGYACTAKISALIPPTDAQKEMVYAYYSNFKATSNPTIAVIQDTDSTSVGSFWGEVQVSIHKALGGVGTVTDGGVRDLEEVRNLGFGYFAGSVLVSHGYVHLEDYDCPVEIGGLTVKPGDLLHADQHGVLLIPKEIAPELAEACRYAQYAEEPVITTCRKSFITGIDLSELRNCREEMAKRRREIENRFLKKVQ